MILQDSYKNGDLVPSKEGPGIRSCKLHLSCAINTSNMTSPRPLVKDPVDIPFENGIILTTTINPLTQRHSIQCDLCEVTTDLGISTTQAWQNGPQYAYASVKTCRSSLHAQGA
jgi:hypothetical protein